MSDQNVIELMDKAIDQAQELMIKAVDKIMSDKKDEAINLITRASGVLDMENDNDLDKCKQFEINDKVWVFLPYSGNTAGVIKGFYGYDEIFVCLIAGPDSFNQQLKVNRKSVIKRKD